MLLILLKVDHACSTVWVVGCHGKQDAGEMASRGRFEKGSTGWFNLLLLCWGIDSFSATTRWVECECVCGGGGEAAGGRRWAGQDEWRWGGEWGVR